MKTRSLLKLSLITTLIGIFILIILSNNLEPEINDISSINEKMIDEWVKIKGNVTNQAEFDTLTILTIYDGTAGIRAIIYKKIENIEGHEVIILGKIIEYKNELEIEISKIQFIEV